MNLDIMKIGAELSKENFMDNVQSKKEIEYKMSVRLLKILHRRGVVTDVEYAMIDELNRQTFSPALAKVYV
jgi:hypothetical protein